MTEFNEQAKADYIALAYRPYATATCSKCGHPLGMSPRGGDRWAHIDPTNGTAGTFGSIGCRAASFDRPEVDGWDDTLDRRWKATPVKGSEVSSKAQCST